MDIDGYIRLIQQNFPQLTVQIVTPITKGWDSFVLDVNNTLIFRFPMRDDVIEQIQRELRLLPILAPTLSTPIPHFTFIGKGNATYPYTFVGYPKIGGQALENACITSGQLTVLAQALATFLNELHSFPTTQAIQVGVQEHTPVQWRDRYQERYIDLQQRVFPLLNTGLRVKSEHLWENFLNANNMFTFQPRLIHCDLACEHIFYNPERSTLTGVIDWGDVTIGDSALDFVGFHQTHGKEFTEQVLMRYQGRVDAAFQQRIHFYLCYGPFSQLLYGSYSKNQMFITQGIEGLHALFNV